MWRTEDTGSVRNAKHKLRGLPLEISKQTVLGQLILQKPALSWRSTPLRTPISVHTSSGKEREIGHHLVSEVVVQITSNFP